MKPVASVLVNIHIPINGTNTRKVTADKSTTLERLDDGVLVTLLQRDGSKKSLWIPDSNVVCIDFPVEAPSRPEAKK